MMYHRITDALTFDAINLQEKLWYETSIAVADIMLNIFLKTMQSLGHYLLFYTPK